MNALHSSALMAAVVVIGGTAPAARAQSASQDQKEGAPTRSQPNIRLSTGVSYSKGDYGDIAATKVFAIPVSLTYRNGPLKLRVSVPWVRVEGPGSLIVTPTGRDAGGAAADTGGGSRGSTSGSGSGSSNSGPGGGGSSGSGSSGSGSSGSGSSGSGSSGSGSSGSGFGGGTSGGTGISSGQIVGGGTSTTTGGNRRTGIGDINLSAVYSIAMGGGFYVEPGFKLKLPTASTAKRLGTGKVDVTPSLDLVKDIGDASVYLHGRRKFAGKPAGSAIRSTWGAGAGASVRTSDSISVGADYDWQQSPFAGGTPSSEVSGWVNFRFSRRVNMTVYAGAGTNANSADFLGGTSISVRF